MLRCVAHVPICKGSVLTNPSLRKFDWAIQQTSTPLKPLVYNNKWIYFEFFDRSYQDWESASGKWSTCPKRKACRVKTCSPVSKLKPRTQRSPDPSEIFVRKSFFLSKIWNLPVPEESLEKKPSTVLKPRSRPCAHGDVMCLWQVSQCRNHWPWPSENTLNA